MRMAAIVRAAREEPLGAARPFGACAIVVNTAMRY
jgi:hypothetical protein